MPTTLEFYKNGELLDVEVTRPENDTTIFYNPAIQDIPTEMMYHILQSCYTGYPDGNDVSSFTAPTTPEPGGENNFS